MNGTNGEPVENKRSSGQLERLHHTYSSVPGADCECCPKEHIKQKPWQRAYAEISKKGSHLNTPVTSVPSTLMIVLLGVFLLLAFLTQLVEDDMPRVRTEADLGRTNIDRSSEERILRYLHTLMGNESRVCGTPHHLEKTIDLKRLVDDVARNSTWNVWTDWQKLTGDFWLNYAAGHVSYYQNVSNIVAVLEGDSGMNSDGTTNSAILVNCHYDSVPYSLGTADDAIFCAVMVEALNLLSRQTARFKHNIVFLWNGAEENTLQGAHAFLSHPWFYGVTSVVNLDAGGMNGKSNLFQVTDPRLMRAFSKTTSRPSGQSFGELLFATGLIPSDTDFRIWRHYGDINGIDIAYIKWGHVYHTRYDHPDMLKPGVLQQSGDMLFELLKELGNMEELVEKKPEPTAAVYWDYLYTFMATYSYTGAHVLDTFVLLFTLSSVGYYIWVVDINRTTLTELLWSMLGRILAILAGVVVVFILTPIVIATTIQLRYLSQPWIVVPLYWIPYLVAAVGVSQLFDAWRAKRTGMNRSLRTCQAMAATRLIVAFVLFIFLCMPSVVSARYLVTVPLFLMSFAAFVNLTILRIWKLEAWQHLLMECLWSLPSSMFLFSIALRINAIMLPIMGRDHSDDPDWTVAILNIGLAVFVPMTLSGIELLFSRKRIWIPLATCMVACIIIMFIPMSPYSDDGPSTQRHYWFHTEVVSYAYTGEVTERHAGVLLTKHDAHTPHSALQELRARGLNYNVRTNFRSDCEDYIYCNLPLYRTRFNDTLDQSIFLETNPPAPINASMILTNKTCTGDVCTLSFNMTGPPHNIITLWPRLGVNLTSWTLQSALISPFSQHDRPVYVIVHSHATYSEVFPPMLFDLTIVAPSAMHSGPLIEISHHAHKIDHPQDYTPEYRHLVEAMPAYFNIATFLTNRSNYIF